MKVDVKDIAKIDLKEDELLLIQFNEEFSYEDIQETHRLIARAFPREYLDKIIIADGTMTFRKLTINNHIKKLEDEPDAYYDFAIKNQHSWLKETK